MIFGKFTLQSVALLCELVEKEHTPTNDSGVLVEGSYHHTPSSSAESFAVIKDPPSVKPTVRTSPEPQPVEPVEHFPIKVREQLLHVKCFMLTYSIYHQNHHSSQWNTLQ